MRALILLAISALALTCLLALAGCGHDEESSSKGELQTTAPVDNKSPAAATAGAAPADPSIIYPGGGMKGKKK